MKDKFLNKKVIVTGHTGFKGSWLSSWLKNMGANVTGISLDIPSEPSHFEVTNLYEQIVDKRLDIRNEKELKEVILEIKPDFLFHLAVLNINLCNSLLALLADYESLAEQFLLLLKQ